MNPCEWDSVLSSSCLVLSGRTAKTNHVMLLHGGLFFEHMTIAGVQEGFLDENTNNKIKYQVDIPDSMLVENRYELKEYHSMKWWHIPLLVMGFECPNCVSYVRGRLGLPYKLESPDEFYKEISGISTGYT